MISPLSDHPLPKGWRWVRLGDVCQPIETTDPRAKPHNEFTYVDISSIDAKAKVIAKPSTMLGGDAPVRAKRIIREGDVLVATTRPNLNAVALVGDQLDSEICSTGLCVLRPMELLTSKYLYYFVRSEHFVGSLSNLVQGAMYPAVTDKQVYAQFIPLPPLDEQHRIIARLEEQMVVAAHIQRAAEQMVEATRILPSSLLRKIFPAPLRGENLPQRWRWVRLEDVCEIVIGKTPSRSDPDAWGGNHPWVKISDMDADVLTRTSETLSDRGAVACRGRLLRKGTLLYSFKLTIGKTAFAGIDLFTNEAIAGLTAKGGVGISMPFMRYMLTVIDATAHTGHAVKGKTLNKRTLAQLSIPLPPLEEQHNLVARFEEQMAAAERLRRETEAQVKAAAAVPSALLRDAFVAAA